MDAVADPSRLEIQRSGPLLLNKLTLFSYPGIVLTSTFFLCGVRKTVDCVTVAFLVNLNRQKSGYYY